MTYNNTHSSPAQCASYALFVHGLDQSSAFAIWINIFCIALPYTLYLSYFCAMRSRDTLKQASKPGSPPRPFFGKTEKWFCACTVFLGINILLFLIMFLLIQAQQYCSGGPISEASYVAQWIFQGLLAGGTLATSFLCWVNSLMAVKGKEDVLWNWWVFKWEAYIIASPFILIAMGIVMLVKGPAAGKELKSLNAFQEWRSTRSHPMEGLRKWRRRLAEERTWWGGKRKEVFVDAPERSVGGIDLERGRSPTPLLARKDNVNLSLQSPSTERPPPYTSDDPLN